MYERCIIVWPVSEQGQSKQTSATAAETNTCDVLLLTLAYLYVFPFLLKGWVRYYLMIRQVVYQKDLLNPSSPGERTNTMCTIYQSYSKSKDEWCGKNFLSGKRQIASWTEQGIVIKTIWPLSVAAYTGGPAPMGHMHWKEDISHTGWLIRTARLYEYSLKRLSVREESVRGRGGLGRIRPLRAA